MAAVKLGSGKELQAVTVNIKEQRILEKTLQTLELEKTYALKLIQLDKTEIKTVRKQLNQSIIKIRSHLEPVDITTFKMQEINGTFKPPYQTVNVSGASRIAAASKRLKLHLDAERATPRRARQASASASPRRQVAQGLPQIMLDNNAKVRPRRVSADVKASLTAAPSDLRPATSQGFSQKSRTSARRPDTVQGFSSHSARPIDVGDKKNRSLSLCSRKVSTISHSLAGSPRGREKACERRQELLEQELRKSDNLEERRKNFLERAASWSKENPTVSLETAKDNIASALETADRADGGFSAQKHLRFAQNDVSSVVPAEVVFLEAWKDLKKCRYLRIKPEDMDYSGVNTLVSEQMKLLNKISSNRMRSNFTHDITQGSNDAASDSSSTH